MEFQPDGMEMNTWDNDRAAMGQYGYLVRENASFDGCGTASLYHPNERKKQLFSNDYPTFVDTHFAQTMAATASLPPSFVPEGYYQHPNEQHYGASAPVAEQAAPVEAMVVTKKKRRTMRRKASATNARARPNQGGGGGPRALRAAPALVQPKYAVYPRQELRQGQRFGMRQPDHRLDPRAKPTVKYAGMMHPDRGHNHNHCLPFISHHTNHRSTSEF